MVSQVAEQESLDYLEVGLVEQEEQEEQEEQKLGLRGCSYAAPPPFAPLFHCSFSPLWSPVVVAAW